MTSRPERGVGQMTLPFREVPFAPVGLHRDRRRTEPPLDREFLGDPAEDLRRVSGEVLVSDHDDTLEEGLVILEDLVRSDPVVDQAVYGRAIPWSMQLLSRVRHWDRVANDGDEPCSGE